MSRCCDIMIKNFRQLCAHDNRSFVPLGMSANELMGRQVLADIPSGITDNV